MMTTPSETVKEIKTEKGTEDTSTIPKIESHKETYRKLGFSRDEPESYLKPYSSTTKSEAYSKTSENFQKSRHGGQESEGTRQQRRRSPPRQAGGGLVGAIKRFLRNMTHVEWSILGGLMLCFYLTVVFNQTNIFGKYKNLFILLVIYKRTCPKILDFLGNINFVLKCPASSCVFQKFLKICM